MEGVEGFHGQGLVPEFFPVSLLTWSAKPCSSGSLKRSCYVPDQGHPHPGRVRGHPRHCSSATIWVRILLYIIQRSLPSDNLRNNLFFSLSLKMTFWGEQTYFIYIYIYMNLEPHNNNSYHYIKG